MRGVNAQSEAVARTSLDFKTSEKIPTIGMGTWLTFNINPNSAALSQRRDVLTEFYKAGGGMIDSSPMYGRAELKSGRH